VWWTRCAAPGRWLKNIARPVRVYRIVARQDTNIEMQLQPPDLQTDALNTGSAFTRAILSSRMATSLVMASTLRPGSKVWPTPPASASRPAFRKTPPGNLTLRSRTLASSSRLRSAQPYRAAS
jgi:hypothetical protein